VLLRRLLLVWVVAAAAAADVDAVVVAASELQVGAKTEACNRNQRAKRPRRGRPSLKGYPR
jgi:hypothetical protein